jgi:MSHA pilin protein MshD
VGKPPPQLHECGLTLVELLVAIIVVGIGVAGVLSVLSLNVRYSADPLPRKQALAIAESLMEEVTASAFTDCDPDFYDAGTGACTLAEAIGPEAGETRSGATPFDNVNDYHGFSMIGIADATGTAVAGLSAYSASVGVVPEAFDVIPAGEALRVTVTVTGPNNTTVALDAFRTKHAPNP